MALPPYQFHENLPNGSKVISAGQTGDLISLLSFLESRLKITTNLSQKSLRHDRASNTVLSKTKSSRLPLY
jgi:hypothetical protein